MKKPIRDWTLGEIVAECGRHRECNRGCPIYTGFVCEAGRVTGTPPDEWGHIEDKA